MELLVFSRENLVSDAAELGLDMVMVDLEWREKARRQDGVDTDITTQTISDLEHIRSCTDRPIVCRIDRWGDHSAEQIDQVVAAGADEILIPMVRYPVEAECALEAARGRVPVGIMVETVEAVTHASELASMPIARAYVGLNDLWIERRTKHRFSPFVDGTIDHLASSFRSVPFGVAGLTHPDLGRPLQCRHLVNELVRLDCDFTILRRSFFAAIEERPATEVVAAIRAAISSAADRTPAQIESDRGAAWLAIDALAAEPLALAG